MSSTPNRPYPPVLIRAGEAERLDLIGHVLLADSSATAGALDQPPRRARPRRRWRCAAPARPFLRAVLHPRRRARPAGQRRHRHCAHRRSAGRPSRRGARVHRPSRLDRRGADHRHSRHRTIRLLPPRRPAPAGQRAARAAARAARPLRHPLSRQSRPGNAPARPPDRAGKREAHRRGGRCRARATPTPAPQPGSSPPTVFDKST